MLFFAEGEICIRLAEVLLDRAWLISYRLSSYQSAVCSGLLLFTV